MNNPIPTKFILLDEDFTTLKTITDYIYSGSISCYLDGWKCFMRNLMAGDQTAEDVWDRAYILDKLFYESHLYGNTNDAESLIHKFKEELDNHRDYIMNEVAPMLKAYEEKAKNQ